MEHLTEAEAIETKEALERRYPNKSFVLVFRAEPRNHKYDRWLVWEELPCEKCGKTFRSSNHIGKIRGTCSDCERKQQEEWDKRSVDSDPRWRGPEPEDNESDRLFWRE